MPTVNWKFNTQIGHAQVGTIRILVTPLAGTTDGKVAFGVIAPNGVALKTINPNFIPSGITGTGADQTYVSAVAQESFVANIPLDTDGKYMNGTYRLSIAYNFDGSYGDEDTVSIIYIDYVHCDPSVSGNANEAKLTYTQDALNGQLIVTDLTDYTGVTIATHQIVSTPVLGGAAVTETLYAQTLPLAAYTSVLTTNGTKTATTTVSGTTISHILTITATLNSPASYGTYKSVLDKATIQLRSLEDSLCEKQMLTKSEKAKAFCLLSELTLLNAYVAIGYDSTDIIRRLNYIMR